ncbi:MAG: hypothetical protein KF874_13350 [Rhizobiaceae bacterium]|nr:hypothetical protein [Rhizobiaceae bacterium]
MRPQNAEVLRLTSVCDTSSRSDEGFDTKLSDIETLRVALVSPPSALDQKVQSYGWVMLTYALASTTDQRSVVTGLLAPQQPSVPTVSERPYGCRRRTLLSRTGTAVLPL